MTDEQILEIAERIWRGDIHEPTEAKALQFARALLAAAPTPATQSAGQEAVSGFALAGIGRKHFGNPIPQAWYAAARHLLREYAALDTAPTPAAQSAGQEADSAARGRVTGFLDAWARRRGNDPEVIHGLDGAHELLISDLRALLAAPVNASEPVAYVDMLFDGPPSNMCGRFVEAHDPHGKSINAGQWIERDDGLWALRIAARVNGGERSKAAPLFMTGWQLLEALDLAAPDRATDPDQMDEEIALQMGDETCHSGAGLYAWEASEPDEGSTFLAGEGAAIAANQARKGA